MENGETKRTGGAANPSVCHGDCEEWRRRMDVSGGRGRGKEAEGQWRSKGNGGKEKLVEETGVRKMKCSSWKVRGDADLQRGKRKRI